jgi:DNA-binding LacI/PurR family transcriptional regulator
VSLARIGSFDAFKGEKLLSKGRVTMQQIAEEAGVSRTTVSLVLNHVPGVNISPETRQRILDVAHRLNYIPDSAAKSLVSGRTGVIALVLLQSPHQVFSDGFLATVLLGLTIAVRDSGYHVLIEPLDPANGPASYGDLVRSHRADGIILSGPRLDDKELIRIYSEGIPVVMMGQLPGTDIPFVDVDNVRGAITAVQHLLALGHRRIACITNAALEYTASSDRLVGYHQALEGAGIPHDDALVRYGAFTDTSGTRAMDDLLANCEPLPTAVFVASDVVALGALSSIRAAGLDVPHDMALVGFDDIPLAEHIHPSLTTVRLPAYDLGWHAGQVLMRMIETGQINAPHLLLDTELVIRETTLDSGVRDK